MQIRLAQKSELPILENLARQIWPPTYTGIISTAQIDFMLDWMYSTSTLEKQLQEGHEFYILATEGKDIGFIALEWTTNQNIPSIKINKLYVLPSNHGLGGGRKLLLKALERAQQTQITKLFLQVNKANKAVDFYKKHGFTVQEETIFEIGNGFVMDDYVMARMV